MRKCVYITSYMLAFYLGAVYFSQSLFALPIGSNFHVNCCDTFSVCLFIDCPFDLKNWCTCQPYSKFSNGFSKSKLKVPVRHIFEHFLLLLLVCGAFIWSKDVQNEQTHTHTHIQHDMKVEATKQNKNKQNKCRKCEYTPFEWCQFH